MGLYATAFREFFWNMGIFSVTPKIKGELGTVLPFLSPLAAGSIGALVTGAAVGCITTPIAGLKTVIQASEDELSLIAAFKKLTFCEGRAKPRMQQAFCGGTPRAGYLGVSMCVMNVVYETLPSILPAGLKRQ